MNELVDEFVSSDEFTKWAMDMLTLDKAKWSFCPKCHCKVQADFPDYTGRASVLRMFLEQAKGKPAETKRVDVQVTHKKDLEGLSDEELEALINGAI